MFGSRKAIVFDPYRGQRRRKTPAWLLLLVLGFALGIAAVAAVQQKLLPPRLSAADSHALRESFAQASAERDRLLSERDSLQQQLDKASSEARERETALTASQSSAENARADLATLLATLPPDPRAAQNTVEVRAARFTARRGGLDYQVVLTRRKATKPLAGVMQIVVVGSSAGGKPTTLTMEPVALSVKDHEIVSGSMPLPDDFTPRQTTVRVLDGPEGRSLGMRVLNVDSPKA
jgi:Skp family chaperone for outer membrane proteins